MTSIITSVKSYIYKPTSPPVKSQETSDDPSLQPSGDQSTVDDVKENDAPELKSDKKTDESINPADQPGVVWRLSSGLYHTATGALSLGVDGVKWAAGKSYGAGKAVVDNVPPLPKLRKKPKDE